eukprot:CAMPEP_0172469270 /NCGR_PEP_ID=MMETSP1065-20121228/63361_1 /TAXON_ID=265537 /ORGANISM="Amphiprora paludosa, Strain CCMP125" /LENGTH=135 /DNA_ID=CAMNT_0013226903 /DNA_START=15 /DNA_END=422 /DNA_ORIENTATION=+
MSATTLFVKANIAWREDNFACRELVKARTDPIPSFNARNNAPPLLALISTLPPGCNSMVSSLGTTFDESSSNTFSMSSRFSSTIARVDPPVSFARRFPRPVKVAAPTVFCRSGVAATVSDPLLLVTAGRNSCSKY